MPLIGGLGGLGFAIALGYVATKQRATAFAMITLGIDELVTACAFLAFAEAGVEAAVVEVGLGGRLDATNIVRPRVCAITTISYDHQSLLGDSLAEIAREKAGIVKRAVPVVTSCRARRALRVLRARARALGAPLLEIDRSCRTRLRGEKDGRYRFDLETPARAYRGLRPRAAAGTDGATPSPVPPAPIGGGNPALPEGEGRRSGPPG